MTARSLVPGFALLILGASPLSSQSVDGQAAPPIAWTAPPFAVPAPLRDSIRFGVLEVPRLHDDPSAGTFRLSFLVLRALTPAPHADPIVFVPGGPGMAVIEPWGPIAARAPRIALLRERRDFVIFEPRGHGLSEPRACRELDPIFSALTSRPDSAGLAAVRACRDSLARVGIGPDQLSSDQSARDLEMLRRALGAPSLNLLGVSYGSRIAAEAVRDIPSALRAVAFVGPVPPEFAWRRNSDSIAAGRMAVLFTRCAADAGCRRDFPDLRREYGLLLESAARSPLPVVTRRDGRSDTLRLDARRLSSGFAALLGDRDLAAGVPALVHAIAVHGLDRMAPFAARIGDLFAEDVAGLTFIAFSCADATAADLDSGWMATVCPAWSPGAGSSGGSGLRSAIPALILAGELDPRTPPDHARVLAAQLPRSHYVELPWTGHDYGVDCANAIEHAFFEAPDLRPAARCADSIPPIRFAGPVVPSRLVAGAARIAARSPIAAGAAAAGLLLVLLGGPLRAVTRARISAGGPGSSADAALAAFAGVAGAASIVGVAAGVAAGAAESPIVPMLGLPERLVAIVGLPWILLVCTVALSARLLATRRSSRRNRQGAALAATAAAAWLTLAACAVPFFV